jgi:hypothetical protein
VGMQASATTQENNMEASLKTKQRSAIWSSNSTPRDTLKGMWLTLMFMAALFTIAKLWKQPRCPTTDE